MLSTLRMNRATTCSGIGRSLATNSRAALSQGASCSRVVFSAAARESSGIFATTRRAFASSSAVQKLQSGLAQELQHEKENYEKPEVKVPAGWNFVDEAGNVNMKLEKTMGDRVCKVEWQLVSPPMVYEDEGEEAENPEEPTEVEVTITIQNKEGTEGLTYFCATTSMEGAKEGPKTALSIGNVKTWNSAEEKDNPAAFNGPEFDDLDDRLQEAMEEYLAEMGVNEEVQEFVNACAADKEQREYMRWMENLNKFIKAA